MKVTDMCRNVGNVGMEHKTEQNLNQVISLLLSLPELRVPGTVLLQKVKLV